MANFILIVDDEADLRDLLKADIESKGYNVISASSGNEAFDLVKKNCNLDLVITDVMMPNGNGIDLLKNIKTLNSQRPAVIMITGYSTVIAQDLIDMGAFHVLYKPFDRTEFFDAIQKSIESRST